MNKWLGIATCTFALATLRGHVFAEEISGVHAAALDQPRIYMTISRAPGQPPLAVRSGKESSAAIEAFLDTGASAIILSHNSSSALNIAYAQTAGGQPIAFEDVGVGGSELFRVSGPLQVAFASYSSNTDGENLAAYVPAKAAVRLELRQSSGLLDELTGGTDVAGMPAMAGQVMVIDSRPVNKMDKLKTAIVPPGDRSIPRTTRTIPLTYVSFDRFVRTVPAGAQGPTLAANPLIGPDPFHPSAQVLPIVARYRGKTTRLTMLLDTGAVCSMISRQKAAELGVEYAKGGKRLDGVPADQQFTLAVGGIGNSGQAASAGFSLDNLILPVSAGPALAYAKAPVIVHDITLRDATTGKTFTLDGVFGMNFLTASAQITGGLLPDIGDISSSPFEFIVVDHARRELRLK